MKYILTLLAAVFCLSACMEESSSLPEPGGDRTPSSLTEQSALALEVKGFSGRLLVDAKSIVAQEASFTMPVYTEGITAADQIDTLALEMKLPEAVLLDRVNVAAVGATVHIQDKDTSNPIIYFNYPPSEDEYHYITSEGDPLFVLSFSGEQSGELAMQASYLSHKDRIPQETDWGLLDLKK